MRKHTSRRGGNPRLQNREELGFDMDSTLTYYAIVDTSDSSYPAGIVRRLKDPDGGFVDEGLHSDLAWHRTSIIVEWERGESTDDLVMISEHDVKQVIAKLEERWKSSGKQAKPE
jgi:hypothetical protein